MTATLDLPGDVRAAIDLHQMILSQRMLPMWTITARPRDYPDQHVARCHVAGRGGSYVLTEPTIVRATLAQLRHALKQFPHGLRAISRSPGDDPIIVETWL